MVRISNSLGISFDTNEIIRMSNNSSQKIKVEPRIMRVLQILIDHRPNVVSREYLISEVWDNYGGADDALNQSISHLRKLLKDTDKEKRIIETVVKKGYRFTGEIYSAENGKIVDKPFLPRSSKFWVALIIMVLIGISILIYMLKILMPTFLRW